MQRLMIVGSCLLLLAFAAYGALRYSDSNEGDATQVARVTPQRTPTVDQAPQVDGESSPSETPTQLPDRVETPQEKAKRLIAEWSQAIEAGDTPRANQAAQAFVALGDIAISEFVTYLRDFAGAQPESLESKREVLSAAPSLVILMDPHKTMVALVASLDTLRPISEEWLFGAQAIYDAGVKDKPLAIHESSGITLADSSLVDSLLALSQEQETLTLGNLLEYLRSTQIQGSSGEQSFREPWLSEIAERLTGGNALAAAADRNSLIALGVGRSARLQAQLKWLIDATASLQDLLVFLQSADPNAFSRAIRAFVDKDENWRYIPNILSSVLAMKGWQRALGVVSDVSSARWYQRGDGSDDKRIGRFAEALSRFSPGSEEHSLMREALSWVAIYSMLMTKGSKMTFGRDEIETPLRALSQRGNFNATFSFSEQVNNITYSSENRPSGQAQWVLIVESATSAGDGARKLHEWMRTAPKTDLWSALENGYDLAIFVTYNRSEFYAENPDSGDIRAFVERLLQEMAKIDPSSFVEVHIPDALDAISEMIVGIEIDLSSEAKLSLVELFKLYDNWKKRSGTTLDAQRARQFERIERLRGWLAK